MAHAQPNQPPHSTTGKPLSFIFQDYKLENFLLHPPVITTRAVGTHLERQQNQLRIELIKRVLRHGGVDSRFKRILPFRFDSDHVAEAPGIEGLKRGIADYVGKHGKQKSIDKLDHYFQYLGELLAETDNNGPALKDLRRIRNQHESREQRYDELMRWISEWMEKWRAEVRQLDGAGWSHRSRTQQIFVRGYELKDVRKAFDEPDRPVTGKFFRDFDTLDFLRLRRHGFNCIRPMGIFIVGEEGAKGTAGGSPFAIKRYEIDPKYGTEEDVRKFCTRAEAAGIRVIFDFVPNHTSIDSDLAKLNPRLFVHKDQQPSDDDGYYHYDNPAHGELWIRYGGFRGPNGREFWRDTLQLDIANQQTRDILVAQALDIIERYGVHALRVDSAYQMLNHYLGRNWGEELSRGLPTREFLSRLVTEIKLRFPNTALIAEAFDKFDDLSEVGFDLVYGINDQEGRNGARYSGMMDALRGKDPVHIRRALQRCEFLLHQEGGASLLVFWGQHDRQAPWHTFGNDWKYGAAALTLLMPGAVSMLTCVEACFEKPCKEDGKILTFNEPFNYDWSGIKSDPFGEYQLNLLKIAACLQNKWQELKFQTLTPSDPQAEWVGYMIQKVGSGLLDDKVLVLANPTDKEVEVVIDDHSRGIYNFRLKLPPRGPKGQEHVWIDGVK